MLTLALNRVQDLPRPLPLRVVFAEEKCHGCQVRITSVKSIDQAIEKTMNLKTRHETHACQAYHKNPSNGKTRNENHATKKKGA